MIRTAVRAVVYIAAVLLFLWAASLPVTLLGAARF